MWNLLIILFRILHRQWFTSLSQLSRFLSLSFESFLCFLVWVSLHSSYLEFVEHFRYLYSQLSSKLESFQPLFLQIVFVPILSSSDCLTVYMLASILVLQKYLWLFTFLQSFLFLLLWLHNFHCPLFTNSSFCMLRSVFKSLVNFSL